MGANSNYELGLGCDYDIHLVQQLTSLEEEIVEKVIENNGAVYYLTSDGDIYWSGNNSSGQLGDGTGKSPSCLISILEEKVI